MCTRPQRHPLLCIVPPHLLVHLSRLRDPRLRKLSDQALRTLLASEQFRGNRRAIGGIATLAQTPAGVKRRTIFDAGADVSAAAWAADDERIADVLRRHGARP